MRAFVFPLLCAGYQVIASKLGGDVKRRARPAADVVRNAVNLLVIVKVFMSGEHPANKFAVLNKEFVYAITFGRIFIER